MRTQPTKLNDYATRSECSILCIKNYKAMSKVIRIMDQTVSCFQANSNTKVLVRTRTECSSIQEKGTVQYTDRKRARSAWAAWQDKRMKSASTYRKVIGKAHSDMVIVNSRTRDEPGEPGEVERRSCMHSRDGDI